MKPYPVHDEKIELSRPNPAVAQTVQVSAPVPPVLKGAKVKARTSPKSQLSLIGLLKGLVYVDEFHRTVSYTPKRAVLVCSTTNKKLAFAYGARASKLQHTAVSSVVLGNFHEFNGFPVRQILDSVTTRKYDGTKYLGQLTDIVYWSDKCIDGESCRTPSDYHHKFEPDFPKLFLNSGELLLLEGGSYTINRRGIVG